MGMLRKLRQRLRQWCNRRYKSVSDSDADDESKPASRIAGQDVAGDKPAMSVCRAALTVARPFFFGRETRLTAIGLSVALGVLITLETWVIMYFSQVNKDYMTALQKKDVDGFYGGLRRVAYVIAMFLPVIGLHQYVQTLLHIEWRTALTQKLAKAYLTCSRGGHGAFYHMQLAGTIDNPDQRICQDAKAFIDTTLSLVVDTVSTVFKVVGFASMLYSISPAVCVGVVSYAAVGTVVSTFGFGPWVMKYQQDALSQEATLRYCLIRTRENAESIAFFRGGDAEWKCFRDFFDTLLMTLRRQMVLMTGFNMFQRTFNWATFAVAPLMVGPAYLRGDAEFGDISQAAMAFNVILGGLTIIMGKLDQFCSLAVEVRRLNGLQQALDHHEARAALVASASHGPGEGKCVALREIVGSQRRLTGTACLADAISVSPGTEETLQDQFEIASDVSTHSSIEGTPKNQQPLVLSVRGLTLRTPLRNGAVPQTLLDDVTVRLRTGESLLVAGTSGIGKSSLLRAIAGLWSEGLGVVERCQAHQIFFMPQHPYMFLGSLREQLLYPDVQRSSVTPTMLEEALERVNLGYLLQRHSWNDSKDWASLLSLGEQQRINFARVLLARDLRLALIDEGTSACDPDNEARLYELLRDKVASYVSVGHRRTLLRYHTHVLSLERRTQFKSSSSAAQMLGPAVGNMMPMEQALGVLCGTGDDESQV